MPDDPNDPYADINSIAAGTLPKRGRPDLLTVAQKAGISPDIANDFSKVINLESGNSHYDRRGRVKLSAPDPRTGERAVGLTQIKPSTARPYGLDVNDESQNLEAGLRYFAEGGSDPVARRLHYFGGPKASQRYQRTGRIPQGGDVTGTTFRQYVNATGAGGAQISQQPQQQADPYKDINDIAAGTAKPASDPYADINKIAAGEAEVPETPITSTADITGTGRFAGMARRALAKGSHRGRGSNPPPPQPPLGNLTDLPASMNIGGRQIPTPYANLPPEEPQVAADTGLGAGITRRRKTPPVFSTQINPQAAQGMEGTGESIARKAQIKADIIKKDPFRAMTPQMNDQEAETRYQTQIAEEQKKQEDAPKVAALTEQYRNAIQALSIAGHLGPDTQKWVNEALASVAGGLGAKAIAGIRYTPTIAATAAILGRTSDFDTLQLHAQALQQAAAESGADRGAVSKAIQQIASGTVESLPELGLMSAGVPAPLAFGMGSAASAAGRGASGQEIGKEALHGAASAAPFEIPVPKSIENLGLRLLAKAGVVGGGTAAIEGLSGATPQQAANAGTVNALYGIIGELQHAQNQRAFDAAAKKIPEGLRNDPEVRQLIDQARADVRKTAESYIAKQPLLRFPKYDPKNLMSFYDQLYDTQRSGTVYELDKHDIKVLKSEQGEDVNPTDFVKMIGEDGLHDYVPREALGSVKNAAASQTPEQAENIVSKPRGGQGGTASQQEVAAQTGPTVQAGQTPQAEVSGVGESQAGGRPLTNVPVESERNAGGVPVEQVPDVVREAQQTERDRQAIREMFAQIPTTPPHHSNFQTRDEAGQFTEEAKPGGQFDVTSTEREGKQQLIFKKDGVEVGEIAFVPRADGNYEVSNVLVWPKFQRQGAATEFYRQAFEKAQAEGKKLYISEDRTPDAQALHAKFAEQGFLKPDGEINFGKGVGEVGPEQRLTGPASSSQTPEANVREGAQPDISPELRARLKAHGLTDANIDKDFTSEKAKTYLEIVDKSVASETTEPVAPEVPVSEQPKSAGEKQPIGVGDKVYFEDAYDPQKRHEAQFRGWDGDSAVIIWNGSQMRLPRERIFSENLPESNVPPESAAPVAESQPTQSKPEPWQQTAQEFYSENRMGGSELVNEFRTNTGRSGRSARDKNDLAQLRQRQDNSLRERHRAAVEDALREGKSVPPEVLADYPDLKRSAEVAEPKSETKPTVGQRIKITGVGDKGSYEMEVKGEKDGNVEIGYPDSDIIAARVPKASFKQYVDDLAGRVDVPANSDRPEINAVASGRAEYLGKGDDGLAFRVGDSVVKVSTVVPYVPTNPGVASPEQAVARLRAQTELSEEARKAGVPGILYTEFVEHGGKGFQIRPYVEIPESMTDAQLSQLRDNIEQMNEKGYTNHDQLQAGIRDGQVYMYDTGKLAKLSEKENQRKEDIEDDSRHFVNFAKEMGQADPLPTKQQARRLFDMWRESGGLLLGDESHAYGDRLRRALIASGEDEATINKQFEEGLEKHEDRVAERAAKKAAEAKAEEAPAPKEEDWKVEIPKVKLTPKEWELYNWAESGARDVLGDENWLRDNPDALTRHGQLEDMRQRLEDQAPDVFEGGANKRSLKSLLAKLNKTGFFEEALIKPTTESVITGGEDRALHDFVVSRGRMVKTHDLRGEINRIINLPGGFRYFSENSRQGNVKVTPEIMMDAANAEGFRNPRTGLPFEHPGDFLMALEESASGNPIHSTFRNEGDPLPADWERQEAKYYADQEAKAKAAQAREEFLMEGRGADLFDRVRDKEASNAERREFIKLAKEAGISKDEIDALITGAREEVAGLEEPSVARTEEARPTEAAAEVKPVRLAEDTRPEGVKVKKSADFEMDGTWEVTLPNGVTRRIFRDPEDTNWFDADARDAVKNPETHTGLLSTSTKNNAIQALMEKYGGETKSEVKPEPTPKPISARTEQLGLVEQGLNQQEASSPKVSDQRARLIADNEAREKATRPDLAAATNTLSELKRRGMTVDDYERQQSLIGEVPTPEKIALLRALESEPELVRKTRVKEATLFRLDEEAGGKRETRGSGGPDTEEWINKMIIHGWELYAKAKPKFEAWADDMRRQFGEHVEPHLRDLWAEFTGQREEEAPKIEAPKVEAPTEPRVETPRTPVRITTETAPKDAAMQADREILGLPELEQVPHVKSEEVLDEAKAANSQDPRAPDVLVEQALTTKKNFNNVETMQVNLRAQELKNRINQLDKDLSQATTPAQVAEQSAALDLALNEFDRVSEAQDRAGAEWSRAGTARQRALKEDYSLAAMVARFKKDKFKATQTVATPEEVQQIQELHRKLEEAIAENEKLRAAQETKESDAEMERFIQHVAGQRPRGRRSRTEILTERHLLKKDLQALVKSASPIGFLKNDQGSYDPAQVSDLTRILRDLARNYIEDLGGKIAALDLAKKVHGDVKDISDLTQREVNDLISGYGRIKGATQDPVERKLNEVKAILAAASGKADVLEAGLRAAKRGGQRQKPSEEMRRAQRELNEATRLKGPELARQPYDPELFQATPLDKAKTTAKNRIEQLQTWLKSGKKEVEGRTEIIPDAELTQLRTERDALEKLTRLLNDPATDQKAVEKRVADLNKIIAENRAKIASGEIAPVTKEGARAIWTPEVGKLEQERAGLRDQITKLRAEEAKRVREAAAATPDAQAAAQREAIEKRLKAIDKQIADIQSGATPEVKEGAKAVWSPEVSEAQQRLAEARAQQAADKGVQRAKEQIAAGGVKPEATEGAKSAWTKAIGEARQEREALNGILSDMRTEEARKAREAAKAKAATGADFYGAEQSWAEFEKEAKRSLNRFNQLKKQQADLEQKIATQNFEAPPKRSAPKYTRETVEAQKKVDELKRQYNRMRYDATKSWREKAMDEAAKATNVPKTFKTIGDVSAMLRQGGWFALSHPYKGFVRPTAQMMRSFSEAGWMNVEQMIKEHKKYAEAKKMGLEFTGVDQAHAHLNGLEEGYLGGEYIDLMAKGRYNYLGKAVKLVKDVSERTFVSFLDAQRMEMYDTITGAMEHPDWISKRLGAQEGVNIKDNEADYKRIAAAINSGTGRGSLGKRGQAWAPALNVAMFSPRLIKSRVDLLNQMFNPYTIATMPRNARAQLIKDNVKFLAATGTILALVKASGGKVSMDPDDAEFLKIRFGDTVYDQLAGLQQPLRYIINMTRAMGPTSKRFQSGALYSGQSKSEMTKQFLRSKVNPALSPVVDYISDQDFEGRKFSWKNEAKDFAYPLPAKDVVDGFVQGGVIGALKATPTFLGIGVGSYPAKAEKTTDLAEKLARKYVRESMPVGEAREEDEIDVQRKLAELRGRSRAGENVQPELDKLGANVTARQIKRILAARNETRLFEDVKSLSADKAIFVYAAASPEQRQQLNPLLQKKSLSIDLMRPDEQDKVRAAYEAEGFKRGTIPRAPRAVTEAKKPHAANEGYLAP